MDITISIVDHLGRIYDKELLEEWFIEKYCIFNVTITLPTVHYPNVERQLSLPVSSQS